MHVRDMTVPKLLERNREQFGDRTFLTYIPDGRRYSYRETDDIANRLGNGLMARGVTKGQHVAVMMDNSPEQLFVYFALGKIGAVTIKVNTAARGQMLKYFLTQSDSTALIVDADYLDRFFEICEEAPAIGRLIVNAPDGKLPKASSRSKVPEVLALAAVQDGASTPPAVEVLHSDLGYISYTSGTTGPSKGVMFTHARNISGGVNNVEAYGHRHTDVCYVCLPMYHTNAMQGSVYPAMIAGGSIALAKRFSVSNFWSDCREHGATVVNMLGSMVNFLWSQPPGPDDANHMVRMAHCSPTPKFALEFERRFGVRFISGYGLTDYQTPLAFTLNDPPSKLGSPGRPRIGFEVAIVDDDDFPLPAGEKGEIVIRCNIPWYPSIGYYKMPEKTIESMRNGWFHTGDRGYMDEDGYFWFVDRKKDAIRRRGENVSAFEVEQILLNHPAVADAAVFPMASELSEEEVACAVVAKPGQTIDEKDLIAYCVKSMSYFMVPRFVRVMDHLPMNLSQKVEKYKLQTEAAQNRELYWDREKAGIVVKR